MSENPVSDTIMRIFPREQWDAVRQELARYGTESYETGEERVWLAVLKLSKGDLVNLIHFVDVAKQDWRDVLMWADEAPD